MAVCVIIVVFYHKWRPTCEHFMFLYIIASLDDMMYTNDMYFCQFCFRDILSYECGKTHMMSLISTKSCWRILQCIVKYTGLILQKMFHCQLHSSPNLMSRHKPKQLRMKRLNKCCAVWNTLCTAYNYSVWHKDIWVFFKTHIIMISNNITLICCIQILDKLLEGRFGPIKVV